MKYIVIGYNSEVFEYNPTFFTKKTFNFQRRCSVDVNIPICLTENLKKSNFTTSSDLTIASQEPRSNFEIGEEGGGEHR